MARQSNGLAFLTGVLAANAIPHAYVAMTGATHMTPLRGRRSGPGVNGLWSAMNAAAALALARRGEPDDMTAQRSFEIGVAVFSVWGLASEWIWDFG